MNERERILANVYGLVAKEFPLCATVGVEWLPRVRLVSVLRGAIMENLRGYWTVR